MRILLTDDMLYINQKIASKLKDVVIIYTYDCHSIAEL